MDKLEIKNARIESTMLGIEDHGSMTFFLYLDYGGSGQGMGGYVLDGGHKPSGHAFGAIRKILETLEVDTWEKLPKQLCRVEADDGKVYRIGHTIKNRWFDLAAYMKEASPEFPGI